MIRQEVTYASAPETRSGPEPEAAVTPVRYIADVLANSWSHAGEVVVMIAGSVAVILGVLWIASVLAFQPLGRPLQVWSILLPAVLVVLLCELAVATWRVHRGREVVMANTRRLVDLNARDRIDLERFLLARHRREELRMERLHLAEVARLTERISPKDPH